MAGEGVQARELNTGIIIAGAYALKIRRSLFAQLANLARGDRETSKEIARASAELNWILYKVIVEGLKADKGDAVRVRIKYTYDPSKGRVEWDYGTLRVELFRRVPDGEVEAKVREALEKNLEEAEKLFSGAVPPGIREAEEWGGGEG